MQRKILNVALHETTVVRPFTAHLTKHPSKTNKTRSSRLEKHCKTQCVHQLSWMS